MPGTQVENLELSSLLTSFHITLVPLYIHIQEIFLKIYSFSVIHIYEGCSLTWVCYVYIQNYSSNGWNSTDRRFILKIIWKESVTRQLSGFIDLRIYLISCSIMIIVFWDVMWPIYLFTSSWI